MSGLLGVYHQDGAGFDERLLNGILQRLRLPGPDAQNIFVERDFASCFSVLQVSPGGNPLANRLCWMEAAGSWGLCGSRAR
jgi:hypothetical protein